MSKARAVCRALYKSGDIRRNKAALSTGRNHAEVRRERCEVIIRDLGLCGADYREDRGLSNAGISDKSNVCDHLELKRELSLLSACAVLCEHRDLTCGGRKMSVTPTAATCLAAKIVRAVVIRHIVKYLTRCGILDERSGGNKNNEILCGCAVDLSALSVAAVFRYELMPIFECKQGVRAGINTENNVSAVSAVTTVRAAVRNVLLASERDRTVSTVARFYIYFYVIYKHIPPQSIPYSPRIAFQLLKS